MPVCKHQFERFDLLHKLLSRSKLTKKEILSLYHENGFQVSNRTFYYDIEYLKDQGAKIHAPDKGDDRFYYIEQFIPAGSNFDDDDMDVFNRCIMLLKSINGFHLAYDLERTLEKSKYTRHIIDKDAESLLSFENHTFAKGSQHIENLTSAIFQKTTLKINYTPFTIDKVLIFDFSPYYIKEYRNRWYVYGINHENGQLLNLGLERISGYKISEAKYIENLSLNPKEYFKYLIGVTIPQNAIPVDIELKIFKESAPYVITKPFINNQEIIRKKSDGSIIVRFKAFNNYELKQNILGFGSAVVVIKPTVLKNEIRAILKKSIKLYV